MRHQLSRLFYTLIVGGRLHQVTRRLNRDKVAILTYHRLHAGEADELENFDGQYVHVKDFTRQMQYLAQHYDVVSLEDCLTPQASPRNRAVITFDDAYASLYHYASPVLKALRLPATVFVPTDFVRTGTPMWWDRLRFAVRGTEKQTVTVSHDGPARELPLRTRREKAAAMRELAMTLRTVPYEAREELFARLLPPHELNRMADRPHLAPLTLAQIHEMNAYGVTFASHGKSHTSFRTLSLAALHQEVHESKKTLEEWTGKRVSWLSYPYGDFDVRSLAVLPQEDYQGAVSTIDGLSADEHRFALRRIPVGGQTTFAQFIAAISGVRDLLAQVRRRQERIAA